MYYQINKQLYSGTSSNCFCGYLMELGKDDLVATEWAISIHSNENVLL